MDPTNVAQDRGMADHDGQYLARAQALMARRAELFAMSRTLSLESAPALVQSTPDRADRMRRTGGRQLSLPIARERGRRRARMLR
jgi:hypothetical protein